MNTNTEQKTAITIENEKQSFVVEDSTNKSEIIMTSDLIELSAEQIIQE